MSLLEDALLLGQRRSTICTIAKLLEVAEPKLRAEVAELFDAVRASTITAEAAAKALTARLGYRILGDVVRRHNRRQCQCPP